MESILKHALPFFKGRLPGQVIIQMTDRCNALCPQCGMRAQEKFNRSSLSAERIHKMIDNASRNGVKAISFTGGEPFLNEDLLISCINRSAENGIKFIRTGTNAYFLAGHEKADFKDKIKRIAERLAETKLYTLWFSLDTWNADLHEQCRGLKGVVKGMEKALPIFADYGIYPSANLGINRNVAAYPLPELKSDSAKEGFKESFKEGFSRFYQFAENLGFTIINACYPMSADEASVYKAESADKIVRFTREEKIELFTALYETIPAFRSRLRIFTPRSSLYTLINEYKTGHYPFPCAGGKDYFYVDSESGKTHPCGFRAGEDMGKYEEFDIKSIEKGEPCTKCDWECFRDPSTLSAPVTQLLCNPFKLVKKIFNNKKFYSLWLEDMKYYKACSLFNGREKPDYKKLSVFA